MTDVAAAPARLRVVVCDDDPVVRSVIGEVVAGEGGEVIAEVDTATAALLLIDRFHPDLVVLDLNLRSDSGIEVLTALAPRADKPRIVVFTAHDQIAPAPRDGVDVAYKPDFDGLARCLRPRDERARERRRATRALPGVHRPTIDDAAAFYHVLAEAEPGDVLACLRGAPEDPVELAHLLRRTVRVQDRVHARSGDVLLLLIGGGTEAVGALRGRLDGKLSDLDGRLHGIDVGDDPIGAFDRLTR